MKTVTPFFGSILSHFSPKKRLGILSLAVLGAGFVFSTTAFAQSTAPLIQQSNITYLGAFALPTGTYGKSNFTYGGKGITPYHDPVTGKYTLFLEGHAWNPGNIAQIEVPASFVKSTNWSSLPQAKVLQNFQDVTDGKLSSIDPTNQYNPNFVYGMLAYNDRLIIGASNSYSFDQISSHGVSGLNLSTTNDFKGFYSFLSAIEAPPRALGGPMTTIPTEWQTAFGGTALSGQCCISVISTTSSGPSVTVFNPNDIGNQNPIPGKTVLFYPLEHPVCGAWNCEATQNNIFNLTTRVGGVAFPPGSRTVLFVGGHGTGPYCYGTAKECSNDTAMPDVKGPHAQPYRYQIWAYDANDLLAVKNGTKQSWEPKPYGIWTLTDMPNSGNPNISGAAYDPVTKHLFITQDYGAYPRVEVYQINLSASGSSLTAPTGLQVK